MADDGKRTELICFRGSERMALDLLRLATVEGRSTSSFLHSLLSQRLYGDMVRVNEGPAVSTLSNKVDREP